MNYILIGGGVLVAVLSGALWFQTMRLENSQMTLTQTQGELATCGGRLGAILRDVESDNEVDNLDLTDFDIPAEWLRPDAASGD